MTQHTNTPDLDDGYALDLTGPVQHIASELAKAEQENSDLGLDDDYVLALDELAAGYTHFAGDLSRVRKHEHLDDDRAATLWLITRAADELVRNGPRGRTQLIIENGCVSLAPGVTVKDLRWRGNPVYPPQNIHQAMGDPFNPMSGPLARNVRKNTGKDDLSDLKESMRVAGWLPGHRAVKDARTLVTLSGHRRLKAAAELRAEGVDIPDQIEYVDFEVDGEGDPADIHRMDMARLSNWGFRRPTPEERQETALWLSEERGMTQQQVAATLGVSQQTVSRDLNKIITQMGNELEPLIVAATAAIRRGLTQSQFGIERGMPNNSMVLAKAFAVAQDRIRREAEAELRARDAAAEPLTTSDAVQDAIREAEETLPDTPATREIDEFLDDPSTGVRHERPERQGLEDVVPEPMTEDSPDYEYDPSLGLRGDPVEPRPAVNPPQDLPSAPQPYADDEPPRPAAGPAAYCAACARSGVGACDDFPDCPAGRGAPAPQPYGEAFAPQDEAAQLYDQLLSDWSWDAESQRWVVQRETVWVTCRLPQDTPPAFPAHLFGVQLASPRGD